MYVYIARHGRQKSNKWTDFKKIKIALKIIRILFYLNNFNERFYNGFPMVLLLGVQGEVLLQNYFSDQLISDSLTVY
jgi:hypothetical protein